MLADVIIVGGGIAGLSAALAIGSSAKVLVVTKCGLGTGGSTPIAQGGIAVAMGSDDAPKLHTADTLYAGAGLSVAEVVDVLTREGPLQVQKLIHLGAEFDKDNEGKLIFGREAAHSRRRILHARGDSTGAEVQRALTEAVKQCPNIRVIEYCFAFDLLQNDEGDVIGADTVMGDRRIRIYAPAIILASGGIGRIYSRTTNAVQSTGDGIAMAGRAGATLTDVEFVQFHPTALYTSLDPLPLLTEALRGEGAVLVDESGRRFMPDLHPDAELAPRDVVARGNWFELQSGHRVYLDARLIGEKFTSRFPTVFSLCAQAGLDPRVDLLPVSPAAHYHMGGIKVDENGRSSLRGLWACGEVAATGVHGANRLASNSLLEGLVFGARVGQNIAGTLSKDINITKAEEEKSTFVSDLCAFDEADTLRKLMWDKVGLVRNQKGMQEVLDWIDEKIATFDKEKQSLTYRNMLDVSHIVTVASLERKESRGAHYRTDYPDTEVNGEHLPFVFTGNGPWL